MYWMIINDRDIKGKFVQQVRRQRNVPYYFAELGLTRHLAISLNPVIENGNMIEPKEILQRKSLEIK